MDILEPEMIIIPNGILLMGANRSIDQLADEYEPDQFSLFLPEFAMGKYPVTVGEYRQFINAGGYKDERCWPIEGKKWIKIAFKEGRNNPEFWSDKAFTGNDKLPVVGIMWFEAFAYCTWLAFITGEKYRLPTEAEWEKAARGIDGRIFTWGNEFKSGNANINESPIGVLPSTRTSIVGSYKNDISPFGLYDMCGNVFEWTYSVPSKPYNHDIAEKKDPEVENSSRVHRGGAWREYSKFARCSSRRYSEANHRGVNGWKGFRLAREI